jgi:hypothetical protein
MASWNSTSERKRVRRITGSVAQSDDVVVLLSCGRAGDGAACRSGCSSRFYVGRLVWGDL